MAGAAMLSSCNTEQISAIYTPEEGDGMYSFNASSSGNFGFGTENPVMTVELYRTAANGAATVPITSTQLLGESTVDILDIPTEAVFEDGSNVTTLQIRYNDNIQADNIYDITLSIDPAQTSPGGNASMSFKASMAYIWESLGQGEFYDNMVGSIVPVEILVATNSLVPDTRYRIMNPYPESASAAIAANVGAAVGGPVSEYIEFVLNPEDGSLSWSGYWNCGVLVDPTLSFSHLNYWFGSESPFSGGEALVEDCGEVAEGVFQFAPHVSAFANEEQSSGWIISNTYEWMALPGIDLAAAIGL